MSSTFDRARLILVTPSMMYKHLHYSPNLYCAECGLPGLIRYVQLLRCRHVLCIFCYRKHKHRCQAQSLCYML